MIYSEEQINKANAVDLVEFLQSIGEPLEKSGKEYRWKAHDSLTVCGNKWFRHSQGKGGYPIAFLMEFCGMSFPEAVEALIKDKPHESKDTGERILSNPFRLPPKNADSDLAIKYLTEERSLDRSVVETFIMSGDIYEDAEHHNVVFVGRDEHAAPRYAALRGIHEKFRQEVNGSDKSFGFSYEGKGNKLFVFEAPIDLLSFICLYPKGWEDRSYISLGGVSGSALEQLLDRRKDISDVYLCLDNDEAGNKACLHLPGDIPKAVTVTRISPIRKDWNDVLKAKDEIPNKKYFAERTELRKGIGATVPVVRMSDVQLKEIDWLWYPYIPFGKVTIIQGNPGEGKTTFALRLAAACSTRDTIPKMEKHEPMNVIYQTAEDGLGDTVKPRLMNAGADLKRIISIDETGSQLNLSDDRIEKAIMENEARLLIIDPIQAYLGNDTDINRANEIRPIMRHIADVADRTGCAIVLVGHLNKNSGTASAYRGLGSIDFRAAVRSLLVIGRVKKEPHIRVICHDKSSLAPEGGSIAFSLDAEKGFEWIGEYEISADDLLGGKTGDDNPNKQEKAKTMILELLGKVREVSSEEIDRMAGEAGIGERTVRAAKAELKDEGKLGSKKVGQHWYHFLKQDGEETEAPDWTDPKQRLAHTAELMGWSFKETDGQKVGKNT